MSSEAWDDLVESSKSQRAKFKDVKSNIDKDNKNLDNEDTGCDWGFSRQDAHISNGESGVDTNSSKFIPVYERYLGDKHSFTNQTENYHTYVNDPQKAIRDWFNMEGNEFAAKVEQPSEYQYICSLDLPLGDHDFNFTSEVYSKKQAAMDEICLAACRMLDECELLYPWQIRTGAEDFNKKQRLNEAASEDDIELDSTSSRKRHCDSQTSVNSKFDLSRVNTYESLLAEWQRLNMCILQLKAKLVRLDLSVTQKQPKSDKNSTTDSQRDETKSDDDEVDPLDEYMSNLESKTELTRDDKIEKSRLKSQIATYEREQAEVSRLIELAKPKFDLNKVCPSKTTLKQ